MGIETVIPIALIIIFIVIVYIFLTITSRFKGPGRRY